MRRHTTSMCVALTLAASACSVGRSPARPSTVAAASLAPEAPLSYGAFEPASGGSVAFGTFVRGREPQLQFCYGETRATSPALAGSATVAVTLDAAGRVLESAIVRRSWSGGKGGDAVEQCVLSKVRAWKFPAADPEDPPDERRSHSFAVIFTR